MLGILQDSYGDSNTGNMLIQGDNLLVLQHLEPTFTGRIKCIYIDPPYNTGSCFEHYDDNVEHSHWLEWMKTRLILLHKLLANDGVIVVHIDDNEKDYLKVMMDGIFGRGNFVNTIVVRDSHPSGLKLSAARRTIIKSKSYMLVYKKRDLTIRPIYQARDDWDTHFNMFMDTTKGVLVKESLKQVLIQRGIIVKGEKLDKSSLKNKQFREFCFQNREFIFQSTKELPDQPRLQSREKKDQVIRYKTSTGRTDYALNGRRMSPLSKSVRPVGIDGDPAEDFAKMLCDFWDDVAFNNTQKEGGVRFPSSKKPEFLIGRILTMFTNQGDLILDAFLGSGTTAAVAHKMGRRWIGIEAGEHAKTHCIPRLKAVIDGEQGGISPKISWQGGGGFCYYELE